MKQQPFHVFISFYLPLQNTMDVKHTNNSIQGSLLFSTALAGDKQALQKIIEAGTPLATDTVGTSALHCAIMGNNLDAVELLIKTGLSIDAKTKVDRTPLHLAAFYGHERIASILLALDCEVDPVDLFQMTPLHWAVQKRHPQIVRLLMEKGADASALSKFNKTPRSMAEGTGQIEVLELLDMWTRGKESSAATESLVLEMIKDKSIGMKGKRVSPRYKMETKQITTKLDVDEQPPDEDEEEEAETMSIFDEDDVVEVIPAGDTDSIDITLDDKEADDEDEYVDVGESAGRVVIQDSDESYSHLHDTIDKLSNMRGVKPSDASTLKILQKIGIKMEEQEPDATIITNVLKSGRRIVLSEAGKHILNAAKNSDSDALPQPTQRLRKSSSPSTIPAASPPTRTRTAPVRGKNERLQNNTGTLLCDKRRAEALDSGSPAQKVKRDSDGQDNVRTTNDQPVTGERMSAIEKQMVLLKQENKQLRSMLEMSIQQVEESQRRIKRLEEVVNREVEWGSIVYIICLYINS